MSEKRVCNCCGKELDRWDLHGNFSIHTRVGYGSVYDGGTVDLRLCCDCFDNLVRACKVSPVMEGDEFS